MSPSTRLGFLLGCLLFSQGVFPAAIRRRGVPVVRDEDDYGGAKPVNHDTVGVTPQKTADGFDGQLQLKYNPEMTVAGGCDPYPFTNDFNQVGAGLKPTGGGRSGCNKGGEGNVYSRVGLYKDRIAIMYCYYVPKVRWGTADDEGHRHYFLCAVVWIFQKGCNPNDLLSYHAVGIAMQQDHTRFDYPQPGTTWYRGGTAAPGAPDHPQLYMWDEKIGSYIPGMRSETGTITQRPIVAWETMSQNMKDSFSRVGLQHAIVPFTDANFDLTLAAAYNQDLFVNIPKDPCPTGPSPAPAPAPAPVVPEPGSGEGYPPEEGGEPYPGEGEGEGEGWEPYPDDEEGEGDGYGGEGDGEGEGDGGEGDGYGDEGEGDGGEADDYAGGGDEEESGGSTLERLEAAQDAERAEQDLAEAETDERQEAAQEEDQARANGELADVDGNGIPDIEEE